MKDKKYFIAVKILFYGILIINLLLIFISVNRSASINRNKNKQQVYNQNPVKQNFNSYKILFVLQFIPSSLLQMLSLTYSSAIHI